MKQSKSHIIKSTFLLLLFLFLKLGIGHAISHEFSHDEPEDCQECVLIVETNNTFSFDNPNTLDFTPKLEHVGYANKVFLIHENLGINKIIYTFRFNKPPPFIS